MAQVTRREFVTMGGTAVALGALARDSWARVADRMLGIQLYTVAADLNASVPGTLKGLNDIGYKCVESAGFAKMSAADFRKALDAAGLQCPSCHLSFSAADPGPLFDDAHVIGARYAASSVLLPAERAGADFAKVLGELTIDDFKKIAEPSWPTASAPRRNRPGCSMPTTITTSSSATWEAVRRVTRSCSTTRIRTW